MQPIDLKLIHQGPEFDIYQLNHKEILKVISSVTPGSEPLSHLENEWEILHGKNLPGIRKVYSREMHEGRQALKMQYIQGVTWGEYMNRGHLEIKEFLEKALEVARQLKTLHQAGYIHNRINPGHLLLTHRKLTPVIIGLGCCTKLKSNQIQQPPSLKDFGESALPYIAPEQTGRTDQDVTKATDLYSLGAILYQTLTGQQPFTAKEPLELIHAHIAKIPPLAHLLKENIPPSISKILEKLLRKIPSERYISAEALISDLEACLLQWQSKGTIVGDLISEHYDLEHLNLSQKFVGRKDEISVLESIFDRVIDGNGEVVLIEGKSGVGKTVFGRSLKEKVQKQSGFFLEGKFDEYNRGIPYSGLTQCFRQFVNTLLTTDQKTLEYWKERLDTGIGPLAGVMIDMVPELSWILKDQQQTSLLEGPEAINRVRYAVRRFIQIVAHEDHPLVFLVDDIQWSDLDSLNLIESILSDTRISHLMMIGTFRDDSLPEGHPVLSKLSELRRSLEGGSVIRLQNLNEDDISELILNTFTGSIQHSQQFVKLLRSITNGNALHLVQLLTALVKDHVLRYHSEENQWRWQADQIERLKLAGDLEELIARMVKRINPEVMKLLSLAACVGNSFDGSVLNDLSHGESVIYLEEAVREGLIMRVETQGASKGRSYQFVHDRIREMAYELLNQEELANTHLQIGEFYLRTFSDIEKEERIFEIVTQFNLGKARISSLEAFHLAARLNLTAGQKAKASGAFGPALQYMKEGISHLGSNPWQENYELTLELYGNSAELASLNGNYEELEEFSQITLAHVKSLLDKKPIVLANIKALMAQKKPNKALALEVEYLDKLGYHLPDKGNKLLALLGLFSMSIKMRGKNSQSIAALPRNSKPREIAALQILSYALITAYFVEPDLLPKIISKMLGISLNHGNAPESAAGYMGYGFILSGYLGSFDRGHDFGNLANKILEDADRDELLYVQIFQNNIFLKHWKEPISEVISNLDKCYVQLLNLGVFESAAFAIHSYLYFSFFHGVDLLYLKSRSKDIVAIVSTLNQPTTLHRIQMYHQAILNLLGESEVNHLLKGVAYDEDKMIPIHHDDNISIAIHNIHFLKAYMAFLFNEHKLAAEEIEKTKEFKEAAAASFFVPLYDFLSALIKTSLSKDMKSVKSHLRKLRKYAESAPSNYLRYYTLVKAELARVLNKIGEARVLYDDAIYQARQAGNLPDEALGWELAGKFYQQIGREDKASTCFQYAYDSHLRWGAKAKANQIIAIHGQTMRLTPTIFSAGNLQGVRSAETFDLLSMVKSLQALSTELDLNRLLGKMMDILIENAGAERGLLILQKNDKWDIIAERDMNSEQVKMLEGQRLDGPEDDGEQSLIPSGIVHYVIRTKRTTVINDVNRDVKFRDLPYLKRRKPRSLLCMPLLNHDNLIGIVYLENTLTTGAFTQRIQEGLNLLSRQLAISLENAILYEELEDKVIQNQNLVAKLQIKVEEQERTLKVFGQFVPGPVVKKTLESKTEMSMFEGELREVAVMFCDIRDFTPISEELKPTSVVELLNDFYAMMTEIILKHSGTVTLFIGDEIMAAFGVPVPTKRNEQNAVLCALEMTASIAELNKVYQRKFDRTIRVGIGINSGSVVAGILGSKARLAYSITGDTVNTAKRIESLTKDLNNGILVSERVYSKSSRFIEARAWDPIQVKGKKEKLTVYEIIGKRN